MTRLNKTVAGSLLGLTLLLGMVAATATSADAQYQRRDRVGRNWDGYPNLGGSAHLRQTALNAGYNEGTKEGQNDLSRGVRSNYQEFNEYRKATQDYSSRMGDREIYRRYYQAAFERGYDTATGALQDNPNSRGRDRDRNDRDRDRNRNRDGYRGDRRGRNWDRYDSWGGSSQLRQTALNAGYNEGQKLGRNDMNRGRQDFRRFDAYQRATKDYSSRLGDRELYRRYYRQGFETGYEDGLYGY